MFFFLMKHILVPHCLVDYALPTKRFLFSCICSKCERRVDCLKHASQHGATLAVTSKKIGDCSQLAVFTFCFPFQDEELEYKCSKCEAKEAVISHNFIRLPRSVTNVIHISFNYNFSYPDSKSGNFKVQIKGHFTATERNKAGVDLVLIQPFLLSYANHVVAILTSIFQAYNFHKRAKEVYIKTWSTSASHSLEGQGTKPTTVNWFMESSEFMQKNSEGKKVAILV